MEKLSKISGYIRWIGGFERQLDDDIRDQRSPIKECRDLNRDSETSQKLYSILESILLWENSVNSISVVVIFNILFWGIVVLEVRGFAAASSAALVIVLCYSTLEAQLEKEHKVSEAVVPIPKIEHVSKIISKSKSCIESLKLLRKNQPGTFCAGVCTTSIVLWLIGRTVNGILLTYIICMSILLGPVLLLKISCKDFSTTKEWDNDIDEFLPAVTEDNLEVLKRAGELGDHSPTPPNGSSDIHIDPFNDDELIGLKMPSHEDGSTDGLELSELELSSGENDGIDGLKIQCGHFEGNSSSDEEEAELVLKSKDLSSHSEESDSEFEIIDSHGVGHFSNI